MPDDPVTIPGQSVDSAESDILGPLQKLLAGVNVLGDSNDSTGGAFSTPDQAVAIIESGATALTKWWSGAIAAVGGTTAISAAVTKFWSDQQSSGVRIALLATTGAVLASSAFALAIIISSDVRARALGASAVYGARAQIATAFVNVAYSAARPPAQAAGPESMAAAVSQAIGSPVASLGDQLAGIDQKLVGMDKRAALVSLAAVRKVAGTADVAITKTVTGVSGTLEDVFLGPGQKSASEVQINVSDPSSGSVKAVSLEDVIEFNDQFAASGSLSVRQRANQEHRQGKR